MTPFLSNMLPRACAAALLALVALAPARAEPETSSVTQGLVSATPVADDVERDLGLVTVVAGGRKGCSGAALNAYWVLTAAHCIRDINGGRGFFMPADVVVRATWLPQPLTAVRIEEYWLSDKVDVALVRVGRAMSRGNFLVELPQITARDNARWLGKTLETYGRGIYQLARRVNGVAMPSVGDGAYRRSIFEVDAFGAKTIQLKAFPGAAIAGGDSGGPTYALLWKDPLRQHLGVYREIVGVASQCKTVQLSGTDRDPGNPWQWVSGTKSCTLASPGPLRGRIAAVTNDVEPSPEEIPPAFGKLPDGPVSPSRIDVRRAMYPVSLDEPLAPAAPQAGAAIRFDACNPLLALGGICPLSEAYEVWGYSSAREWLMHIPSGLCATPQAGAGGGSTAVTLRICDPASTAQRWWITASRAAGPATWTLQNQADGRCLTAEAPSRSPGSLSFTQKASLVMAACGVTDAQRFGDREADWLRRNPPR